MIPFALTNWRILAGIGLALTLSAIITTFGIHQFHRGAESVREAEAQRLIAEQKRIAGKEAKASEISEHVAADLTKARVEIQYRTKTLIEKVPVYVTQAADDHCSVPVGFVMLHNAAASGSPPSLPSAPGGPLDGPSGVPLSAVAETVVANYGVGLDYRAEVMAWRAWYAEQKAEWDRR